MRILLRLLGRVALAAVIPASLLVAPSAASAAVAQPASACAITRGNYTGQRVCDSHVVDYVYSSNHTHEVFVIGTDLAVWHIWQRYNGDPVWSGWRTLGGQAGSGVALADNRPTIRVIGLDYHNWCDQHGPPWSGWYRC